MRIDAISVIPEVFDTYMHTSIMGRAITSNLIEFNAYNLRDYTHDNHKTVDDAPFGGGPGMLMMCGPIFEAVEDIKAKSSTKAHVVFFAPSGKLYKQEDALRLSKCERIMCVCGRYEGMDERVYSLADDVFSVGDYVLTGGELPAMSLIDSVVRLIPGALGNEMGTSEESFSDNLLEYAQYTRPANFRGMEVPEVLLSGNHAEVDKWRRENALERTRAIRPDLLL